MKAVLLLAAMAGTAGSAAAQELGARSYSPAPVGTTFVLAGFGRSQGPILLDPSLDIDNVEGDLWVATSGIGHVFDLAGRQARILAVFPVAWGSIGADVAGAPQRQALHGLVDPRIKLSVGLRGAPALTPAVFAHTPRRTVVGASVTVMPPWGRYDKSQVANLGYNRWAFKPEVGVSHPVGRWTFDGYVGVWMFTDNHAYYPGSTRKRQDPVVASQGHVSYALPRRSWVAFDGTWFAGGQTRVDGVVNLDLQRNSRLGATLSLPLTGQQSQVHLQRRRVHATGVGVQQLQRDLAACVAQEVTAVPVARTRRYTDRSAIAGSRAAARRAGR